MDANNQAILNAVGGVNAQTPTSTLSTGIASADMPSSGSVGIPQQQAPGSPNTPTTPNYMNTAQNFFGGQQAYNPLQQQNPYQPMIRHGIGRDNWSSNMGLDQQAILNSLGLGGQQ